jgi:hypothetical protein
MPGSTNDQRSGKPTALPRHASRFRPRSFVVRRLRRSRYTRTRSESSSHHKHSAHWGARGQHFHLRGRSRGRVQDYKLLMIERARAVSTEVCSESLVIRPRIRWTPISASTEATCGFALRIERLPRTIQPSIGMPRTTRARLAPCLRNALGMHRLNIIWTAQRPETRPGLSRVVLIQRCLTTTCGR